MKANKIAQKNEKFAPTQSLRDENGKPLEWEFKKISAKENEEIRDACTMEVQVKGKPNMFRPKVKTSEYLAKMIAASVVYPDLYDKELQDSYGVMTPEDLVYAMVDNAGEYQELSVWLQNFQGFTKTMDDKVDEAKN
jgi:hypothetical protein